MRCPAILCLAVLLAAPALAHSAYEAEELEIHVLNDEGSDLIEAYGGYDIQDVFVGFTHDATVGADGVYFRIELYGAREEAAIPQGTSNWSVALTFQAGGKTLQRTLGTSDGQSFGHDFDSLLLEVEGRDTHVRRAFVAYGSDLAPGGNLSIVRVESRVDGDLRDVAPGGIPVPGTGGSQEYSDPHAIEGRGILVPSVPLVAPDGYVKVSASAMEGGAFDVQVQSQLKKGGQHVILVPRGDAFRIEGETSVSLAANGTHAFRLVPASGNGTFGLDVLTDLGGRTPLEVVDGVLRGPGLSVQARAAGEPTGSPAPAIAAVVALLGVALARRR